MNAQAPNYPTLYRFDMLETAIQTLAQVAQLNWLTSKDRAKQLQAPRPRADAVLNTTKPFGSPAHYVVDAQGSRRINGWLGSLIVTLITDEDYDNHMIWRSAIMNFMATLDTVLGDNANLGLLPYHSIARCWDQNNALEILPQKGYFESKVEYGLIFNIYPQSFPGGLLTA